MEWRNPDGSLTGGVVIEDGAGNKLGTAANPLNVTGGSSGGGGSNASVGLTGSIVPADATAIGFQNASGNLTVPTPSAGLPIADSGAAATGVLQPAGGSGLSGWLSGIYARLTGTLSVSWSGQSVSVANFPTSQTVAGSVAVSNLPATQLVSAAALPLPTGAAADGTDAAGITQLGGGVGSRGWLSGIYSKLNGTLSVSWSGQSVNVANFPSSQTVAGSVSVSNLPGTQAVSATALPLPIGAAADGTDATGVSQLSGGVGIRGWLSGIYSKLSSTLTVGVNSIPDAVYGAGSTVTAVGAFSGSLGSFSTAGFGKWIITCTAAGSGTTVAWQGSNDGGVTWEPVLASRLDTSNVASSASLVSPAVGNVIDIPCTHALMRLYCSAFSAAPVFSWCFKAAGPSRMTFDQGAANAFGTAWPTQLKPQTSGGVPTSTVIIGAATTNAGNIKASGGQVYAIDLSNNAASWAYFRLYNLAVAPTVGTSAVVAEYGVAPGASRTISFADLGLPFATGIAYSITAGAALNDTTALAAASTVIATIHLD